MSVSSFLTFQTSKLRGRDDANIYQETSCCTYKVIIISRYRYAFIYLEIEPKQSPNKVTFKLGQDSVGIWINRVVKEDKTVIFLLNDIVQHLKVDLDRTKPEMNCQ